MRYVFDHPKALAARRARIDEPHVAPLQAMARRVCNEPGLLGGPLFDPDFGGIRAKVCVLFATPGPAVADNNLDPSGMIRDARRHQRGTGFVSPDNPDRSAMRTHTTLEAARIPRADVVIWNAIPWYLPRKPDGSLNNGSAADRRDAAPKLFELLRLCSKLRVLILAGDVALRVASWAYKLEPAPLDHLWVIACPHTSQQAMNGAPDRSARLQAAFDEAARLRDGPPRTTAGQLLYRKY